VTGRKKIGGSFFKNKRGIGPVWKGKKKKVLTRSLKEDKEGKDQNSKEVSADVECLTGNTTQQEGRDGKKRKETSRQTDAQKNETLKRF